MRAFYLRPEPFSIENGMLTANGKLKRDLIAARMKEEIEEMYRVKQAYRSARRYAKDEGSQRKHRAWSFQGDKRFRGELRDGVIELALHRAPCNEIGSLSLDELERFVGALESLESDAHALIIYSELKAGFCAGADLRELYQRSQAMEQERRLPRACAIFWSAFIAC